MSVFSVNDSFMRLGFVLANQILIFPPMIVLTLCLFIVFDVVTDFALILEHFAETLSTNHAKVFGGM